MRQVADGRIPNRDDVIRIRKLADRLADRIENKKRAGQLRQAFGDAYLDLQFAATCGNRPMVARCCDACLSLIARMAREKRRKFPG